VPGYTRRQLKEDKFAKTAQGAAAWATDHRQTVILTIGIAVIAIVAIVGLLAWWNRENEQANIGLSAAMRTFETPLTPAGTPPPAGETGPFFSTIADRAKAAQKQFKAVADTYSSVSAGKIARYMSGIALEQADDKAGAEQELKKAANLSDKNVSALAKMALASLYRGSNRTSEAVAIYKELSEHPTVTVSKPQAQMALAETYENTDPQQATLIYQQLQKENPQSPAAQMAAQKLAKSK
jgi:tetratricopeptide (TPR) repeat protein